MEKFTRIEENLRQKAYQVRTFPSKEEAAEYVNSRIDLKTVGIGGSMTVHEMGLFSLLSTHNTVYWHDQKPAELTVAEARKAACRSEVYISSVNGIAESGEIVNIDNTGNRVSAISYGPKQVFLIIGENKIAASLEEAISRARNVAAPLNAMRLKKKTPCAVKGDKCYDCQSEERICRNLSVLWMKPAGVNIEIILVNERLGY